MFDLRGFAFFAMIGILAMALALSASHQVALALALDYWLALVAALACTWLAWRLERERR